jgi:rhodanese-related sulfurtransferase
VVAVSYAKIPTVHIPEVQPLVERGWMVLDVRTEEEWASGRIPGAVHIPMDQLMGRLEEVGDHVVCVCAIGGRSARVAQFLNAEGKDAVNLAGGTHAWIDAGMPVEV